ncbi:MAG: hypothetical protein U1A24_16970 [Cypionkella sp.]|nr:hypothetical protein [Cypionkella sp.]MDZ4312241.1 hypothetical protein [Cypionkella sp.]MDZ4392472.1 hypothetical protein [Cypionkella sp.]
MLNILADALLIALRASPTPTPRDRFPSRPTETRWTKQTSDRV